jgi:hypothetical protein
MDDPKLYTKPFYIGDVHFRWIPNQQLDDFTCIPSELQQYLKEMGDPAAAIRARRASGLVGGW